MVLKLMPNLNLLSNLNPLCLKAFAAGYACGLKSAWREGIDIAKAAADFEEKQRAREYKNISMHDVLIYACGRDSICLWPADSGAWLSLSLPRKPLLYAAPAHP
jgi:hypothetical protein